MALAVAVAVRVRGYSVKPRLDYAWGSESLTMLRVEWAAGTSAGEIAKRLPMDANGTRPTRSAVIGKLHRTGIKFVRVIENKESVKPVKKFERCRTPDRKIVPQFSEATLVSVDYAKSVREFDAAIPKKQLCTFLELKGNQCHWPIGDGADALYCGAPIGSARYYCDEHAKFAYRSPPKARGQV